MLAGASLVPGLERRLYPDHRLVKDIVIEPGGDDRYPSLALVEQWGAPHLRLRLRLGNRSAYDRASIDRLVLRTDGGAALALYNHALPPSAGKDHIAPLETVLTDKQATYFAGVIGNNGNIRVGGSALVICAHRVVRFPVGEYSIPIKPG